MTLDLRLYDDAALEALAPKGVVRRARRDLEAGLSSVTERDAKNATVNADSETVRIDGRGPKAAQCTCPATGICRHILLAVMTLNAAAGSNTSSEAVDAGPTATAELCALTQAEIQSFAGADWGAALALANSSPVSTIEESGRNCAVEITDSPAGVTFLAGLGLKGAAFKGPKTRARIIVAAAALIVRAKHGVALVAGAEEDAAPAATLSQDYLDDAARKILHSTRMVLAGASPIAADTLFDLAISARAEAAPRLTSQLRGLTKQAGQASKRLVQFEPEAFLADAARTYALIEALRRTPDDPALTGVVRRDYAPAPAMDLLVLGAVRWSTESGARGLTLHGFAPLEERWHSIVQARGPGADPTFDPRLAFTMPLWRAGAANTLIGKILHLPAPLISADGAIALTLPETPTVRGSIHQARSLLENGAAINAWSQLRSDIAMRRGAGLHRRATPLPALIAPTRFGALSYDDFTQNYEFQALDAFGDAVRLVFDSQSQLDARRLSESGRPPFLLVETTGDPDRPALRPIAVVHDGASTLEVINLTLQTWTRDTRSPLGALQDLLPRKAAAARIAQDPLADLARRALVEATIVGAGEPAPNVAQLEQSCDAAGLSTLAAALRRMSVTRDAPAVMATAYVASETLASLSWV
jgi:hypothetical protein